MLPDFRSFKRRRQLLIERTIRARLRGGPITSVARTYVIHEGHVQTVVRRGEAGEPSAPRVAEVEASVSTEALRAGDVGALQEMLRELYEGMERAQHRDMFAQLDKALAEAGQVLDAKGAPLSPELYFRLLEGISGPFMFDEAGNWVEPISVAPPHLGPKIEAIRKQINEDPTLKSRLDELIESKRDEWIAEQADRRLVD